VEKYEILAMYFTNRDDKSAQGNGKMALCERLHRVRQIFL
jgi:hypothetical protein